MTTEDKTSPSQPANDIYIDGDNARGVLRRTGFSEEHIDEMLADISFPALRSLVLLRVRRFGISTESLMERLGGSQ